MVKGGLKIHISYPKSLTSNFKTCARTYNYLKIELSVHSHIEHLVCNSSKTKRICFDLEKEHEYSSDEDTVILSDLDTHPTPALCRTIAPKSPNHNNEKEKTLLINNYLHHQN